MGLISEIDDRMALMRRMIDRLGVDLSAVHGERMGHNLARIARTCAFCARTDECRAWLDKDGDPAAYHYFCPNADRLDEMPHRAGAITEARGGLSLFERVRQKVADYIAYRRALNELAGIDSSELDRVLGENGMSRSDLMRLLRQARRSPELLMAMMKRLDVDTRAVMADRSLMRELELRCGVCAEQRRCEAWLHDNKDPDAYRSFCPNAPTLDEVAPHVAAPRPDAGARPSLAG